MDLSVFTKHRTKVLKKEHTVLQGFGDSRRALQLVRRVLNQPESFDTTSLEDLDDFILSIFPEEDALKEKLARGFRNPMFNAALKSVNKLDRDQMVARYASTNRLLTSYMEKGDNWLKIAKGQTAFDVWVRMVGATTDLEASEKHKLYLQLTGDSYLLTGRDFPLKT